MYATNISNGFLFLKSIFSGELTPLLIHLLREPGIETAEETMLFRFFRGEPTPFFAFFALARFGTMVETACASHPGSLCYIGAKSMPAPIGVSIARPFLIMFLPDGKRFNNTSSAASGIFPSSSARGRHLEAFLHCTDTFIAVSRPETAG